MFARLLTAVVAAAVLFPPAGWCAAGSSISDELLPMSIKVLGALALVLGLMLALYAVLKRSGRWLPSARGGSIKIIEVRSLAPRNMLYLVQVKDRTLLVASSAEGVHTLSSWDEPGVFAAVLDQAVEEQTPAAEEE